MADQSEGIVQAYAEHLARKAGSVVGTYAGGGTVAGAALAFIASKMPGGLINPGVRNFAILLGAIARAFLGRSIRDKKAPVLKLQAGLARHQAQLAQKLAARPAVQVPAPAPVAQAAPVAPAPVALAPVAPAPVAPAPVAPPAAPVPVAPAMTVAPPALVSPAAFEPAPFEPAPFDSAPFEPAPPPLAAAPQPVPPPGEVGAPPAPLRGP